MLKYLSARSAKTVTIFFSNVFASSLAAQIFTQDEVSTNKPSSFTNNLVVAMVSSLVTVITSSIKNSSSIAGIKPSPIA